MKRERMERLVERRAAVRRDAEPRRAIGRVEEVLVEGPEPHRPDLLRGRTRRNTMVNFVGSAEPGALVDVEIEAATSTTLRGRERALVAA